MGLFLLDDPRFDEHKSPPGHPERPERLTAARRGSAAPWGNKPSGATPQWPAWEPIAARPATADELSLVHEFSYIDELMRVGGQSGFLDADTFYSEGSIAAAWAAAGGAVEVADALWRKGGRALALPRPPGHHARPGAAMGFCLLNHVAVAAARALQIGARRVAIVDWDVHHGNGTEEIFYEDPRVLYISVHQHPLYPGTGAVTDSGTREGRGFNVNVPLGADAGPSTYREVFQQIVAPILAEYGADVLLVSAGFDAHARDPLANMRLDAQAYGEMMRGLLAVAGDAPTGVFLEGGYDLTALEESLAATGAVLAGTSSGNALEAPAPRGDRVPDAVSPAHLQQIEAARRHHAKFWSGL
jgi:acetoin utilization deacetylase AcuC-like enzyme